MRVFHILVSMIFVLLAHHSSASSFLTKPLERITKLEKEYKEKVLKSKDLNLCANFSGLWRGQCRNGDGDLEDVDFFVVKQENCYSIYIDGFDTSVGGFTAISTAPNQNLEDYFPANATRSVVWNDAQTQLTTLTNLTSTWLSINLKHKIWLENNKLYIREVGVDYVYIGDFQFEHQENGECIYERLSLVNN